MSLTTNDLGQIRQIFNEGLETIVLPRFDRLEEDVAELKTDVSILKTDVSILKTDVGELKADVSVLKNDVSMLKSDVSTLKIDMREVKQDLNYLKGRVEALENDIKELYELVSEQSRADKISDKLSVEQKVLKMHAELIQIARQANVSLPS